MYQLMRRFCAFLFTCHLCWCSCPLPESKGLVTKCYLARKEVSCQKQVSPGTVVELSCRDYYKASPLPKIRRRCSEVGLWTGEPISCMQECGSSDASFNPHITYGQPTTRGAWPWHVTIYFQNKGSWSYHCGGSLIRDDIVLTAAHCVTLLGSKEPFDVQNVLVILGKHFREKSTQEEYSQSRQVRRISVYPNFNPRNFENDLALIFLTISADITYNVRIVCSPVNKLFSDEYQLQESSSGVVAGFGKIETGELADELKHATLAYIPESKCREILPVDSRTILKHSIFCAGNLNETNVCLGDSGSSLVFLHGPPEDQRWFVHGVVSGGLPPDYNSPLPCNPIITFFTRVTYFANWLEDETLLSIDTGERFYKEMLIRMENNMVGLVQSVITQALQNSLKSLDEKMEQVISKVTNIENLENQIQKLEARQAEVQDEISFIRDDIKNYLQGHCIVTMTNTSISDEDTTETLFDGSWSQNGSEIDEETKFHDDAHKEKCGRVSREFTATNCAEIQQLGQNINGVYDIEISSVNLQVYCDFETDGGGWTVFQRRDDVTPHTDFNRDWIDYKTGFGNLSTEFWLGLDAIHLLTFQQAMVLHIDMEDFDGNKRFAQYERFSVGNEGSKYRLSVGGYSGDARDSLSEKHHSRAFSTKDKDHDESDRLNCALSLKGGWWFSGCLDSNLNGEYPRSMSSPGSKGLNWSKWKGSAVSLRRSQMKLRPLNFKETVSDS